MSANNQNGIAIGMGELERRLYGSLLQQCEREHELWRGNKLPEQRDGAESDWITFLKLRIDQERFALENLRRLYARFTRAIKVSPLAEDQRHVILEFIRDLGATPAELKKDAAAFSRWFGADAITDRYNRLHARHEQYLAFLLERVAAMVARAVRGLGDTNKQMEFWKRLQLEPVVKPLLIHEGDVRLKLAAFRCLASVLSALNPEIQERVVDDTILQYIYRSALQHEQQVWIQCAALELLVTLSWNSFEYALKERLLNPTAGDDIFVRRRAVQLLARHFHRLSCGRTLIPTVLADPSPFVRQALPKVLIQAAATEAIPALEHLIVKDTSPQVRAAAWLEWPELLTNRQLRGQALELFCKVVRQEKDDFVLRVICLVAERSTKEVRQKHNGADPFQADWQIAVRNVLIALRCNATSAKVRRWASQSLEFIWSECHPQARDLREQFAAFVRLIPREGSRRLPAALTKDLDAIFLGRLWSVICRNDYDVQLQAVRGGYKVIRAHVFGFRWWRWWHEIRHPSPDKRQAFSHTIGRLFDGELHIPSAIMAELAQTKVPGEPLHISAEGGWRPYLPLPDELASCVELGRKPKPFRIFTSEGITNIVPPRRWKRWRAVARLTWHFRHYAEKRNWLDSMQEPPSTYLRLFNELGFKIYFETYADETGRPMPVDPMVERFFHPAQKDKVDATVESPSAAKQVSAARLAPVNQSPS